MYRDSFENSRLIVDELVDPGNIRRVSGLGSCRRNACLSCCPKPETLAQVDPVRISVVAKRENLSKAEKPRTHGCPVPLWPIRP